jgi:hypothetical protein
MEPMKSNETIPAWRNSFAVIYPVSVIIVLISNIILSSLGIEYTQICKMRLHLIMNITSTDLFAWTKNIIKGFSSFKSH